MSAENTREVPEDYYNLYEMIKAGNNDVDTIAAFAEEVDFNVPDTKGNTLFHVAIERKNWKLAEILLSTYHVVLNLDDWRDRPARELYNVAVSCDEHSNYNIAAQFYKLAADKGYTKAQCNLGLYYQQGLGVSQDLNEAIRLYRIAADQGDARAWYNLANCYKKGLGVAVDLQEMIRLYRLAADLGDSHAQCNLGTCYANGMSVTRDMREAERLWILAAVQGHEDAQANLDDYEAEKQAVMRGPLSPQVAAGFFGPAERKDRETQIPKVNSAGSAEFGLAILYDGMKDFASAVHYYKLAVVQGHALAQYNLGLCYENAKGVPKDLQEAARLYRLAAEQGNPLAQDKLVLGDISEEPLTLHQLARRGQYDILAGRLCAGETVDIEAKNMICELAMQADRLDVVGLLFDSQPVQGVMLEGPS